MVNIYNPSPVPPLNEDSWIEKYKPITNPFQEGTGFDFGEGCTLLSHSDVTELLRTDESLRPKMWSVIEGNEGSTYISYGLRWVNVLGYILTEVEPTESNINDILVE